MCPNTTSTHLFIIYSTGSNIKFDWNAQVVRASFMRWPVIFIWKPRLINRARGSSSSSRAESSARRTVCSRKQLLLPWRQSRWHPPGGRGRPLLLRQILPHLPLPLLVFQGAREGGPACPLSPAPPALLVLRAVVLGFILPPAGTGRPWDFRGVPSPPRRPPWRIRRRPPAPPPRR